jgi:hypothetical protein
MVLFLVAFILLLPTIVISYFHLLFKKNAKGYWRQLAVDIDIFGNRAFRSLWSAWFILEEGYQFGHWGETMSSVMGKNQRDNTLTKGGRVLVWILDKIEKDHCLKSINNLINK